MHLNGFSMRRTWWSRSIVCRGGSKREELRLGMKIELIMNETEKGDQIYEKES